MFLANTRLAVRAFLWLEIQCISGEMLESALVAGLLSVGIEVYKLGVLATPGVSYLVRTEMLAQVL